MAPTKEVVKIIKTIVLTQHISSTDIDQISAKNKTFTFRQKHFSGFNQRRLDYIFVSQNPQDRTRNAGILNAVSTNHLRVSVFKEIVRSFPKFLVFSNSVTLLNLILTL